jgi:hypothetical protein
MAQVAKVPVGPCPGSTCGIDLRTPPKSAPGLPGLRPRWTPPKPDRIRLAGNNVKGVFLVKFVEGSDVRLERGQFRVDLRLRTAVSGRPDPLDRAVFRRGTLRPEADAGSRAELFEISRLMAAYRARHGFEPSYAFDPGRPREGVDRQFLEKDELEQRSGEQLADLDLYYLIHANGPQIAAVQERFMNELNRFGVVEQVSALVLAGPPQASADVSDLQDYLDPAPLGIGAASAWEMPGGRGDGVALADVEYDWVTDHEDFPPRSALHAGGRPLCPYVAEGSEHGTAVMGVIGAPHNRSGVEGIAPNVRYVLSSTCRPLEAVLAGGLGTFSEDHRLGRAHNVFVSKSILEAGASIQPGDVLLIEQHSPGPTTGRSCASNCDQFEYVPVEYYQESFDVIRRLTAQGIIVVEAAGNGGVDLDSAVYQGRFDKDLRHSGALLVAASSFDGTGHVPRPSSNTTDRMDLYSWGRGVVTTGYGLTPEAGAPFDNKDIPRFYTTGFGGTSAASAIVAGAVASLQGIRRGSDKPPLTPLQMRDILHRTGTRQRVTSPLSAFIGRQPDLLAAAPKVVAVPTIPSALPGDFFIGIRSSRKVLDVDVSNFRGSNDGQKLQQWALYGGYNQQFRLTRVAPDTFTIMALHSRKCLEVVGASRANRAGIHQARCHGRPHQRFRFEGVGKLWFRIVAVHSGKVLDVFGDGRTDGTRLIQYKSHGGSNQRFELLPVSAAVPGLN